MKELAEDRADDTQGRIRRVVERETSDRLRPLEKAVKRWQVIAGAVVMLVGAGFAAAMFLWLNFARASDVEALNKRLDMATAATSDVKTDVAALKASISRVEDDYHWQRAQLEKIADKVRAEKVPAPEHAIGPEHGR